MVSGNMEDRERGQLFPISLLFKCVVHVAVIVVMNVSVVPGYCIGCCGYRHWYLFLLSRE